MARFANIKGSQMELPLFADAPITTRVGQEFNRGYHHTVDSRTPFYKRTPDAMPQGLPEKAAFVTGRLAGDVASDGTRGLWWRWNHPLAMTQAAGSTVGEKIGLGAVGATTLGYAATTLMDASSGNLDPMNLSEAGRPKGYTAVYASPEDPTKSSEGFLSEVGSRWILGRTGKLLPYEQFKEERPDVSPETYADYQEYLRSPGAIGGLVKGTWDGIDGPEVRFMGYRVPAKAVTTVGGMLGGVALAARGNKRGRIGRLVTGGLLGSLGGSALGTLVDG